MKTKGFALFAGTVLLIAGSLVACSNYGSFFPFGGGSVVHTPKFLVALDDTSNTDNVNVFSVNATTGELTVVSSSPFTTGLTYGSGAVVHPTHGNWVFAADWNGNVQTLVLGANGTPTVASTENTGYDDFGWVNGGLAVTADGKYLYTTTNSSDIVAWSINQSTGALTNIGTYTTPSIGCTYGVAVSGKFLYINDECSYTVQVATIGSNGLLTDLQTVAVPDTSSNLWTLAVDKSGKFLYVGDESATITRYSIGSDGKLTFLGTTTRNGGDGDIDSMSFSADNKFLVTTTDRVGTAVFSVNQSTGDLTEIAGSPFGTEDSYGSLLVDPSSKFVYVSDDGSDIVAYQRNQTNGSLSPLTGSLPTTYTTEYSSAYGFAITW